MSISSTTSRNDYTGNGATDTYSYSFKIFAKTDLVVTVRDTDDVETTLTVDTHYTVSGVGSVSGGSVALVNGAFSWLDGDGDLKSNYALTIRRVRPLKQETDIRNQGEFFPETHEDAFDHFVMIDQQQQDEINRSVKNPETISTSSFDPTLPGDINTASVALVTNSDGDGFIIGPSVSQISGAQAAATAAASSATAAASSAASASSSATAAASSATAAASSATSASSSATSAQTAANSVIWNDVVFINYSNSPYTITSGQKGKMISVDATSGNVSIVLPIISSLTLPWTLGVKKTDVGGNTVTITPNAANTIDGASSKTISAADSGATLIADTDPDPDDWTSADFGASAGSLTIDRFSGNSSTTDFTLSVAPGTENNTWVYVGGVYQQKNTYSVSGTTLSFSSAPGTGTNNIEVVIGSVLSIGTPADGTVSTIKIEDGAVTEDKIDATLLSTLTSSSIVEIPISNPNFLSGDTGWTKGSSTTTSASGFPYGMGYALLPYAADESYCKVSQSFSGTSTTTVASNQVRIVLNFLALFEGDGNYSVNSTITYDGHSSTVLHSFSSKKLAHCYNYLDISSYTSGKTLSFSVERSGGTIDLALSVSGFSLRLVATNS